MKQLNIPKCLHVSIQGKDFITSHSFAFISFFLYVFSHCLPLQKYYYEDLSISIRLHYFTFDYKLSLRIEYYHILNHEDTHYVYIVRKVMSKHSITLQYALVPRMSFNQNINNNISWYCKSFPTLLG